MADLPMTSGEFEPNQACDFIETDPQHIEICATVFGSSLLPLGDSHVRNF